MLQGLVSKEENNWDIETDIEMRQRQRYKERETKKGRSV